MDPIRDYLDVLQNIEFAVVNVAAHDESILDRHVIDAYAAAARKYSRENDGGWFKLPPDTDARTTALFEAIIEICDLRIGRRQGAPEDGAVPLDAIVACLKRLGKSARQWNEQNGRQGYLQFIETYMPR
jgi:hypothetical protein